MIVKTYTTGLDKGVARALKSLDWQVAEDLDSNAKIGLTEDIVYKKHDPKNIIRVVVYE